MQSQERVITKETAEEREKERRGLKGQEERPGEKVKEKQMISYGKRRKKKGKEGVGRGGGEMRQRRERERKRGRGGYRDMHAREDRRGERRKVDEEYIFKTLPSPLEPSIMPQYCIR